MQLDREYILRMIKGRSAGAVVVEGSESGGGGGSFALGPLLTSLNSEAMPSAEGYLHWTGSAWAFDIPTGGDPTDLSSYAQKTWVQDNFAYKSDLTGLLTKADADGYYAPISFVKPYLPLTAGSSYPLTGSLYITGNSGITWVGGYGMLCLKPTSGWAGVTENQWGVGSHSAQGVIRSSLELKRYDGTYQYTIYDSSNLDPLNFIRKDGGTIIGELNVRTQLNIQSAAGANKISFDGTTPNIDIASGGQLTFDVDSHIAHDATNDRLVIHGNNGLLIDSDTYVGTVDGGNQVATRNYVGSQLELFDTYVWQQADNRYLKLIGGTMTGNLVMNGANVAFGPSGSLAAIGYFSNALQIGAAAVAVMSDGVFTFNGDQVATQPWVTAQLGSYLPLTGGTVNGNLNVKGTIQAQDSNGNNKVIIYGTTGNIRAEKVYIGGSTSGYEAATHNWVTSQGYQANVIETVKVAGTALTPTSKAVDIPVATSDGSTFGVVAIGTGFAFDEGRLCVAEAPITMGFKRLNKSTSETWDADTMTVNGTQYALLTNYRSTSEWANMPSGMSWGGVLQITAGSGVGYLSGQLAWDSNHNVTTGVTRKLYWRSRNSTGWGTDDWHTIAFEDWVTGQLGSYLPLTGGTLTNSLFITRTGSSVGKVSASNANGAIELLTYSNRGVYDRTADHWLIGTNGTSTFLLDGNVGIGTTSPAYLLDVNGNARVNGYLYFASGNSNKGTIFAAANENTLNISADNINLNTDSTGWVNINGKPINTTLFRGTGQDDDYKLTRLIMPLTTPDEFGQSYLDLSSYMPLAGDSIKTGKLAVGTTTFDGSNAKLQVGGNMFATGSITSKSNAGNVSLGNGNISATNLYISTVVFGSSNNDPAIYIGNGHVYARNSQGQTTMII